MPSNNSYNPSRKVKYKSNFYHIHFESENYFLVAKGQKANGTFCIRKDDPNTGEIIPIKRNLKKKK